MLTHTMMQISCDAGVKLPVSIANIDKPHVETHKYKSPTIMVRLYFLAPQHGLEPRT